MANRFEYKVVELREGMIGGKMSGDKLEKLLNQQARDGWQLRAITSVDVKGRVGPGGVEGLLVTFERPDRLTRRAGRSVRRGVAVVAAADMPGGAPGRGGADTPAGTGTHPRRVVSSARGLAVGSGDRARRSARPPSRPARPGRPRPAGRR